MPTRALPLCARPAPAPRRPRPAPVSVSSLAAQYLGPYADYEEMLEFASEHGVKPQVEIMPATEVNAAIAKVRNNSARYRVVLDFGSNGSSSQVSA